MYLIVNLTDSGSLAKETLSREDLQGVFDGDCSIYRLKPDSNPPVFEEMGVDEDEEAEHGFAIDWQTI